MGAERMVMTHRLTGIRWWKFGYQPRHRSTRQAEADAGWPAIDEWDESTAASEDQSMDREEPADESAPASEQAPDVLDHLSSDQLRHLLEGCALEDVARIVRPLVQIIAHPSHTAATLATTWGEFSRSTQDAYALHLGMCRWSDFFRREELGSYPAEDAVEHKLREADHAWRLLTLGMS
jgi:hypothetical protein